MALTVKAEREGVFMRYYKYSDTETNNEVNRSLICIPVYDKQTHGTINDNGSITWDSNFIAKYEAKSFENAECLICKYLPICMGICPRDYGIISYCKFNGMDIKIEDALVNYNTSMCRTDNNI